MYILTENGYEKVGEIKETTLSAINENPVRLRDEFTIETGTKINPKIEEMLLDIEPNNARKLRGLGTRRGLVNRLYRIRREYAKYK